MKNDAIKKLLTLSLIFCLSLAACGKTEPAAAAEAREESSMPAVSAAELTEKITENKTEKSTKTKDAEEISTVNKGKLTVAACTETAPYEFYTVVDGKMELAGIEVSMVKYIADRLQLELEILPFGRNDAMNAICDKKADLAILALSPDPALMESIDFSDIYYVGGQSFVAMQKAAGNFKKPENVNRYECKIGVKKNSPQYIFLKQTAPNASVVERDTTAEVIEDLERGGIDGAYLDYAAARYYASVNPEITELFNSSFALFGSSIGVMKGNEALLAAVNEAIASAQEDGSLDRFITEASDLAPVANSESVTK